MMTAMFEPQDEQGAIAAFLSAGAAYSRPDAPVERIDTHASIVFLVEDRVFKLKRAIRYSYLDYSTVAKREAACRAELALNRRTAPALYLAVRAITRAADGRLALDGEGEPVDWLVEMKRFPQEHLFDRLAEQGRLTARLMRELADEIAAFHSAAAPCAGGGPESLRNVIGGNDENLRLAGGRLDQTAVRALRRASETALDRLGPLLDRRRAAAKVRHCHGDLHLGNICLYEDRPTLFDGIEFNEAFTCIDTLYDLAFLLMDLHHRRLEDFAAIVFNRYCDRSGETDGLAALPLFLSLRAAVRAHVSIAAIAHQHDEESKTGLAATAARYLSEAGALLAPGSPRLIAIGGFSGSGKSTVALALAPHLAPVPGARILRSDVLRKRLAGVAPETRLPPGAYSRDMSDQVYALLFEEAGTVLTAGYSVIADAAFLRESEREAIAAVGRRLNLPFNGFWLDAPPDLLRKRVGARKGDASDADLAVLEQQLTYALGPLNWTRLDAGGDIATSVAAARRHLTMKGEA